METDQQRTAVVLAASKGRGRACPETLASRGFDLVVCSRTQQGLDETVAVLSNAYRPALAGVIKSVAVELGPDGITGNIVSPGRLDTARVRELDAKAAEKRGITRDEARTASEATIPMGRYGQPDDLAQAVTFLVSEQAGDVTGQSLLIDGGLVPTIP